MSLVATSGDGCAKACGAKRERPGLDACFNELRPGDILLAWRLDRLGRSVLHLVTLIDKLKGPLLLRYDERGQFGSFLKSTVFYPPADTLDHPCRMKLFDPPVLCQD